jgi:phage antirepressor YoqD-like protein
MERKDSFPEDSTAGQGGNFTELELFNAGPSPFDKLRRIDGQGEHWWARDLQVVMTYDRWESFADVIDRAMAAARVYGDDPDLHFSARSEKGTGGRPRTNFRLTRRGAYFVAMNGDPRKPAVAAAQAYFTESTLEAEAAREQHPKAEMVPTGTPLPDFTRLDPEVLAFIANLGQAAAAASQDALAQRKRIAELTPGYELAETFAAANGTMTVRTFARNVQQWAQPRGIKVLQQHVFDYLGMIGMIIRSGTSEKGQATATALKAGWCENATTDYDTRTRGTLLTTYARLTPKGVNHAWKRIHATIGEFNTLDPKVIRP